MYGRLCVGFVKYAYSPAGNAHFYGIGGTRFLRRRRKKRRKRSAHSSARMPAVTATRWFKRGWSVR
nr:MAG TPA: hypothetical protein [Caudoviricetes sp.]